MKFNTRTLLAWTAIAALLLTIFRRPLNWLWDNGTQSPVVQSFLNAYRHLAWLAGYDVEYFGGSGLYGSNTSGETIAECLGFVTSIFVRVALGVVIVGIIIGLLDWAKAKPHEGD